MNKQNTTKTTINIYIGNHFMVEHICACVFVYLYKIWKGSKSSDYWYGINFF